MIGGMSETPIYDQTTKAQGFNPGTTDDGYTIEGWPRGFTATIVRGGNISLNTYELSPETAAQIQKGAIGGMSIGKGGRKR